MVGIDSNGTVKVWLNSDFSRCHPEDAQDNRMANFNTSPIAEEQMVD